MKKATKKKTASRKITLARTLAELAEQLGNGVTPDGLANLRLYHRDQMPKPTDRANRYHVPTFLKWWKKEGAALYAKLEDPKEEENLRDQKTREEIRKLRMENDAKEGILSDPTEQIRHFALAVQAVDRGLDELAMRLAPKVTGLKDEVDAKLLIEDEVARLKVQLGDFRFEDDEETK